MVTQIITHLSVATRKGKDASTVYRSPRLYLATKLTDDSAFPFRGGDRVIVEIAGDKLVVRKAVVKGKPRRSAAKKQRS